MYFDFFPSSPLLPFNFPPSKKQTADPLIIPLPPKKRKRGKNWREKVQPKNCTKIATIQESVEMNNATSKFGAWDHSFSISRWRNNISAAGEGREMGEDDCSLGSARKRVENCREVSRRRTRTSHPLASNATKFPYLGLTYTLARPFPRFFHPLSLSKPGRTTTSFLHKSRAFNARFERGRTSRRV